jgi:hypothetical protein
VAITRRGNLSPPRYVHTSVQGISRVPGPYPRLVDTGGGLRGGCQRSGVEGPVGVRGPVSTPGMSPSGVVTRDPAEHLTPTCGLVGLDAPSLFGRVHSLCRNAPQRQEADRHRNERCPRNRPSSTRRTPPWPVALWRHGINAFGSTADDRRSSTTSAAASSPPPTTTHGTKRAPRVSAQPGKLALLAAAPTLCHWTQST